VSFAELDNYVRGYLSADPEAYLILILRLVPPGWWMDAHPQEMVGYAKGPAGRGYDEAYRVERPSLASEPWRRDMMALWRRALAHLEQQPWGKRIIGYQPGYGIYTEWHYYGSWTEQMPDTGPAMTRYFRAWLRRRYGTVKRLRAAWADPSVTFETAAVPGLEPRKTSDLLGLRDPARRRWVMDYYRCQQELTADCLEAFCRAAKEITGGRVLCGAFYGYFHGVPPQTQGGHLELGRLLRSPWVDYFAAPYDYGHRLMGQDGRLRCLPEAFALRGKFHLVEDDTRTFLHPVDEYGRAPDAASSIAALRRQLAAALIAGAALWWCDFGPELLCGWYEDPRLSGEVARLVRWAQRRLQTPRQPVAQVAVVCDLASMYLLADAEAMRTHYELLEAVTTELYRCGAPFDALLLEELPQADLRCYRLLIFLDTLQVEPAMRAQVKESTRGRWVLWLWAPGICDGRRLAAELVEDLTGFRVAAAPGGAAVREVVAGEDSLLARLPVRQVTKLRVERAQPVRAAQEAANWYNPRDAQTMRERYTAFEWSVREGTLRWKFATTDTWTDLHLQATIAACDGLRLGVAGEGEAVGLSLRVVVKDAHGAEFVAPRQRVRAEPTVLLLPLQDFTPAPWSRPEVERPRLPLGGLKLVLDGAAGLQGVLLVRDLEAVEGVVEKTQVRSYEVPLGPHPCLVVEDPRAQVVGRDLESGAVVVAARSSASSGKPRQVISTAPFVPRELLVALMDEAGVHRYVDSPEVIVRADSRLIALHTARGGPCLLRLPRAATVRDALTGELIGQGRELPLTLPAPSTTLLELE
jgi:hypothetical protein